MYIHNDKKARWRRVGGKPRASSMASTKTLVSCWCSSDGPVYSAQCPRDALQHPLLQCAQPNGAGPAVHLKVACSQHYNVQREAWPWHCFVSLDTGTHSGPVLNRMAPLGHPLAHPLGHPFGHILRHPLDTLLDTPSGNAMGSWATPQPPLWLPSWSLKNLFDSRTKRYLKLCGNQIVSSHSCACSSEGDNPIVTTGSDVD